MLNDFNSKDGIPIIIEKPTGCKGMVNLKRYAVLRVFYGVEKCHDNKTSSRYTYGLSNSNKQGCNNDMYYTKKMDERFIQMSSLVKNFIVKNFLKRI